MSNYPNMSYCMCENTLAAMKQIVEAMQSEGPMFLKEMSRDERRAFEAMFDMCETFMTMTEELEYEERQERDGQPDEDLDEYETEELLDDGDGQPDEAQEWADFDHDC